MHCLTRSAEMAFLDTTDFYDHDLDEVASLSSLRQPQDTDSRPKNSSFSSTVSYFRTHNPEPKTVSFRLPTSHQINESSSQIPPDAQYSDEPEKKKRKKKKKKKIILVPVGQSPHSQTSSHHSSHSEKVLPLSAPHSSSTSKSPYPSSRNDNKPFSIQPRPFQPSSFEDDFLPGLTRSESPHNDIRQERPHPSSNSRDFPQQNRLSSTSSLNTSLQQSTETRPSTQSDGNNTYLASLPSLDDTPPSHHNTHPESIPIQPSPLLESQSRYVRASVRARYPPDTSNDDNGSLVSDPHRPYVPSSFSSQSVSPAESHKAMSRSSSWTREQPLSKSRERLEEKENIEIAQLRSMIAKMKNEIQEKDHAIRQKDNELNETKQRHLDTVSQLEDSLNTLRIGANLDKGNLSKATSQIESLQSELKSAVAEKETLARRLGTVEKETEALRDQLDQQRRTLETTLRQTQEEKDAAFEKAKRLQELNSTDEREREYLLTERARLTQDKKAAEEMLDKMHVAEEQWKRRVDKLQRGKDDAEQALERKSQEAARLQEMVKGLESQREESKRILKEARDAQWRVEEDLKKERRRCKERENELSEKESRIDDLKEKVSTALQLKLEVERSLDAEKDRVESLKADKEKAESELEHTQYEVSRVRSDLKVAEEELRRKEKEISRLRDEVAENEEKLLRTRRPERSDFDRDRFRERPREKDRYSEFSTPFAYQERQTDRNGDRAADDRASVSSRSTVRSHDYTTHSAQPSALGAEREDPYRSTATLDTRSVRSEGNTQQMSDGDRSSAITNKQQLVAQLKGELARIPSNAKAKPRQRERAEEIEQQLASLEREITLLKRGR
ncbi:hypothetical protein BLNAU_3680 [Blattamonas nauphoetae]|uniref:Uncharacterized protein n=1 Tax=Blattamonas nauphoetae TaxID=2049346 RepID=A0ABQ9YC98_9EUKA|nr:hypothetical protein BLNAU_3680 [Blattamonas nauphoetae]